MAKKRKKKKVSKKKKSVKKTKKKKTQNKSTQKTNGEKVFKVSSSWSKDALIDKKGYESKYSESIKSNEEFWAHEGKRIDWIKPYTKIKDVTYSKEKVDIKCSMTEL